MMKNIIKPIIILLTVLLTFSCGAPNYSKSVKNGDNFELHGASIDGEFLEAMTVIYGIISAYEEKTNT